METKLSLLSDSVSTQKLNVNSLKALYTMFPDTPITQDIELDESINNPFDVGTYQSLLHKIVQTDDQLPLLEKLCSDRQVNTNVRDVSGKTPLFYCSSCPTAGSLLSTGWTDMTVKDYRGKTILDYYLEEFPPYFYTNNSKPEFFPVKEELWSRSITVRLIDAYMRQHENEKISLFRKILFSKWQGDSYIALIEHFVKKYEPHLDSEDHKEDYTKLLKEIEKLSHTKTMTNLMPLQDLYKKLYSQANSGWIKYAYNYFIGS